MIYAKSVTYGLDAKIYELQQDFEDQLPWQCENQEVSIYGKIYPNPDSKNQIIPEAYIDENEYRQIFVDDKIPATIGFLVIGNRVTENSKNRVNVDVIVTVNLDKIYTGRNRDDEKALLEVMRVIRSGTSIEALEIKEGVENVFSGFYIDNILFNNMQPWYVFSVNIDLEYEDDLCLHKCND
jgi:hypothetical protein